MHERDTADQDHDHFDHWTMFADADLTIEGHRLIAQEIVYESKLLWRGLITWLRDLSGAVARRGSL